MEQIRSFIAIELPEEIKTALARLQSRLKSGSLPYVKWVEPAGIHLTLKFLGSIPASKTAEVTGAMAAAARGTPPFRLELDKPGAFPNLSRVQVIWAGISGEIATLQQLYQRLEAALAPLGFPAETRRFTAHLTLARLRDQATAEQRQSLGQLIAATGFTGAQVFRVDAISLMKSQLTREGAIYSRLGLARLEP